MDVSDNMTDDPTYFTTQCCSIEKRFSKCPSSLDSMSLSKIRWSLGQTFHHFPTFLAHNARIWKFRVTLEKSIRKRIICGGKTCIFTIKITDIIKTLYLHVAEIRRLLTRLLDKFSIRNSLAASQRILKRRQGMHLLSVRMCFRLIGQCKDLELTKTIFMQTLQSLAQQNHFLENNWVIISLRMWHVWQWQSDKGALRHFKEKARGFYRCLIRSFPLYERITS